MQHTNNSQVSASEVQTSTEHHEWPHIPKLQWGQLGYWINATVLTTMIFALLVVIFVSYVSVNVVAS